MNSIGKKICSLLLAASVMVCLGGCTKESAGNADDAQQAGDSVAEEMELGEAGAFRPVDCGLPAQEIYEYPFLGMSAKLSSTMLEQMTSRDVVVLTQEDYIDSTTISYGQMRFYKTTQEQKEEVVMSLDFLAWEEQLEKIGMIGVYHQDVLDQLDELTACDVHHKIGASADGNYEYYISTNSAGDAALAKELEDTQITISEMHELNMSLGYNAFSMDRVAGAATVGQFMTEDVFGKSYTEEIFSENDLTLVNAFATWCSPCVEEMPELEKLRQKYAEKGIKLGVVAVVLDAKTANGLDESAREQAKVLSERSGAQFPFLIPDDGNMNDRLTGIESVPESFFVDKNGNIVSDPYVGANSLEGWSEIVDQELAKLG